MISTVGGIHGLFLARTGELRKTLENHGDSKLEASQHLEDGNRPKCLRTQQSQSYSVYVYQQKTEEMGLNCGMRVRGAVVSMEEGQMLSQFHFFFFFSERHHIRINKFITGTKGR